MDILHDSALNPVPAGAVVQTLRTGDGITLRAARWPALSANPKGTLCLFPGRTEYIEKYFETIAELRQRGFAVAVLDWRGQGGSQRLLGSLGGHITSFALYQHDVDAFMRDLVLPDCPLPLFALGHSMGGAILLDTLSRVPNRFDRAVLTAPMTGLHGAAGKDSARYLARFARLFGLGRVKLPSPSRRTGQQQALFENNVLTRDEKRFFRNLKILEEKPELIVAEPTVAWVDSASRLMARFENTDFIARIRAPLLVMAAGADVVVSNPATARLVRRLRVANMIMLDGARHEILMETDPVRAAFFAAFDSFIPGTDHFEQH
jgi:lysophospholipase